MRFQCSVLRNSSTAWAERNVRNKVSSQSIFKWHVQQNQSWARSTVHSELLHRHTRLKWQMDRQQGFWKRLKEGSNRLKKKLKCHNLKFDKKKLDQICWYGLLTDEVEVWARGNQMPPRLPAKQKIALVLQPEAYLLVFNKLCASFQYCCW